MAKYKILVIAHALKNNVVAHFGDVVDETQLTTNAAELVKQGFIGLSDGVEEDSDDNLDDEAAKLSNRKEILTNLGFQGVDSDGFKGLSFPDSGVNFSDDDILNASVEEFDTFVEKANELSKPKVATIPEDVKKEKVDAPAVSKKDEVKNSLLGKK